MMTRPGRFNSNLLATLCVALLAAGCAMGGKNPRHEAMIRFHLEVSPAETTQATNVQVGRSTPFPVTVDKDYFLSELQVERAGIVDGLGAFSIALQFGPEGTHLLEQYTTVYRGRRAAILAHCKEGRWIAAPIMQRVATGQFFFTPDATREEAEFLVAGLNRVAELVRKGRK